MRKRLVRFVFNAFLRGIYYKYLKPGFQLGLPIRHYFLSAASIQIQFNIYLKYISTCLHKPLKKLLDFVGKKLQYNIFENFN